MWVTKDFHMMGTIIDVSVNHPQGEKILKETKERLKEYEKRFSANDRQSELMMVNLNAGQQAVRVEADLFDLVKLGKEHSLPADSFLNIGMGVLTKEWRIGFEDARVPTESEIAHLLKVTDSGKIELDETKNSVYLAEGMSIDLGALAKGFIADLIVQELKEKEVISGMINLGGNVLTFGAPPNTQRNKWQIGIQNPLKPTGSYTEILKIKDQSVVTSGIYERVLKIKNQSYHHILNPKTGYPVETDVLSLTIISEKSVEGEIWTTRLFGHSPVTILNKINELAGIEGLIITAEETLYSDGMKNYL